MNNNPYDKLFSQNPTIQQFPIDNSKNPYHGVFSKNISKENPYEYVGGIGGLGESKYDTNVSIEDLYNLDKIRASRQPWYEQAGAMLNQAVVGSVIGQTIQGIGTLIAIPDIITGEYSMDNPIYQLGKGISDWAAETTPIYQTGERFSDSGYWFQGLTSAASAASFILPGWGFAKAFGALGKAAQMGTTATKILQTAGSAFGMRHIEGAMEANEVYEKLKGLGQNWENLKDSEELQALKTQMDAEIAALPLRLPNPETGETYDNTEAINAIRQKYGAEANKLIEQYANAGARLTYVANYANIVFDLVQMGAILKPFSGLTRNVGKLPYKAAVAEGIAPKTWYGKAGMKFMDGARIGAAELTEGIEEQVNYISAQEGERRGKILMGLEKEDGSTLGDRIASKYTKEGEFWDSFIFGAIGGVGFRLGSKTLGMDESSALVKRKVAEMQGRSESLKQTATTINDIINSVKYTADEKKTLLKEQAAIVGHELGLRGSMAQNVDRTLAWLERPELAKELESLGFGDEATVREIIPIIKKNVKTAENLYKKHYTGLYEKVMDDNLRNVLIQERIALDADILDNRNTIQQLQTEYTKLINEDTWFATKGMKPENVAIMNMFATQMTIENIKKEIASGKFTKEEEVRVKNVLNKLQEDVTNSQKTLQELQKNATEAGQTFTLPSFEDITGIDNRIISNVAHQKFLTRMNEVLGDELVKKNSDKQVKEDLKKAEELRKEREIIIKETDIARKKAEELKRKEERIAREKTAKWNTLIDKAVSEKELDSIIDQMDKAEVTTPELIDRVAMKRQSLGGQQVKSAAPKSQQSFDSFLDDIQTAPLEETIPSANIESFDAFLDAQTQESKQEFSDIEQSISYEQKVADIERRRQKELFYTRNSLQNQADLAKTLDFSDTSDKELWKVLGMFFNAVDEFTSKGEKYIIKQGSSKFYKDIVNSKGDVVITIERQGLEYDIFNTNRELAKDIISFAESKGYNKEEENQTNTKYDTEYVDAVKKGEMTKERAMQALEKVGRMDSAAYAELASLEQKQVTEESGLEPDNTDLGTLPEETFIDVDTEIKSDEITTVVSDNTYFDDSKSKVVSEAYSSLVEDMKNANGAKTVDSDGNITYENSKIENAYNALAHQDRKYTRIKDGKTVKYTDISNELSDTAPLELLTPGKYPIGTKVEFIVADKDDLEIYDPDSMDKTTITWAVYKNRLQELNPGADITTLQDYKNNIPIQLSIDGKELNAYMHSVSWINQENVKGDLVQDAINLRNIREGILNKGSYSTTIESISDGAIFELNNNAKHSIKEAVGEDTNYIIGVETGVGIKTGKNKILSESISNKSTIPGLTYLVVKSHNGYFGIPVSNSKIGNNPNKEAIKSTIVSAIDAYLTDNTETRDSIRNITGLNIFQLSDLEYLLNMYLGFYNTNGNFLRDIIMTIPHGTKNTYFTIQNKTIEFFDGDLKTGGRVYSVSKENQKQKDLFLDKLVDSLDNFYLNNSIEAFDNNENIPIFDDTNNIVPKSYRDLIMESFTTNAKGNKVGEINGKSIYSYTLQPVYRFDFNEFLPKEEDKSIDIDRLKRAYKALKALVDAGNTGGSNLKELQRMEEEIKSLEEPSSSEGLSSDTDSLINGFLNFSDFPGTFNSNFNKDIKNSHKNC